MNTKIEQFEPTIFSNRAVLPAGSPDPFFLLRKSMRRIAGTSDFTSRPVHPKGGRVEMRKTGKGGKKK